MSFILSHIPNVFFNIKVFGLPTLIFVLICSVTQSSTMLSFDFLFENLKMGEKIARKKCEKNRWENFANPKMKLLMRKRKFESLLGC